MPSQLSLESLSTKLDDIHKSANTLKTEVADIKKASEDKKEDEKKAQEKKDEEEKKEATARRARRDAALKLAMEEKDEEKRDAAIKAAMDEHDKGEHKADHEKHEPNHTEKEGMTDEEKEEKAAIASILSEKKTDFINKILSANKMLSANTTDLEARLKKANISELEKEYEAIKPFISSMPTEQPKQEQPLIPYFANIMAPENIDASQLNASSPDAAFAQLSTKDLLKELNA